MKQVKSIRPHSGLMRKGVARTALVAAMVLGMWGGEAVAQWKYIGDITPAEDSKISDLEGIGMYLSQFRATSSFTAKTMAIFWATRPAGNVSLAIYANSSGKPGAMLGSTASTVAKAPGDSFGYQHIALTGSGVNIASGTDYWLGMFASDANNYVGVDGTGPGQFQGGTCCTWANPWPSGASSWAGTLTVYATDSTAGPTGAISIVDRNGHTNLSNPTINITYASATHMQFSLGTQNDSANWVSVDSTYAGMNISTGGQGRKIIWARFRDATPLYSPWVSDTTNYDTSPPTSSITTSGSFGGANPAWPGNVSGTASDPSPGVLDSVKVTVRRSSDNQYWTGSTWSATQTWLRASGAASWSVTLAVGQLTSGVTYTVQSQAYDRAGNVQSPAANTTFRYDTSTTASGTISVPAYTNSATIKAKLSSRNADSMKVALSTDTATVAWTAYADSLPLSLGSAEEAKFVMARFKNSVGLSSWMSDTVIYDITAPAVSISIPLPGTMASTSWPGRVAGSASDSLSGLQTVQVEVKNPTGQYFNGSAWTGAQTWVNAGGATSWELAIGTSLMSAEGAYTFTARATDRAGNTRTSAVVTVTIDNTQAPKVTVAPADTLVLEGRNVTFRATASGTTPSYAWYKQGSATTLATTQNLTLSNVTFADSGSRYFCVATNSRGVDTSAMVLLRVVKAVQAAFSFSPAEGKDSALVTFTDNSTGSIAQWKWIFGDGDSLVYTARRATVTHIYNDTGEHFPRLVVTGIGPAGVDDSLSPQAVRIYKDVGNPLRITARYVSCTKIELRIDSIGRVGRPPIPPFADSIGVWFTQTGKFADTTFAGARWRWGINTIGAGSYTATVDVAAPASAADTVYRFWACPFWNSGPSPYSIINAARVEMRPANEFEPAGRYLGNRATLPAVSLDTARLDSAVATIGNAGAVDTPSVKSVVLMYGFSPAQMIKRDTIAIADFLAGISDGTYAWRLRNPDFPGDTQRVYVRTQQLSVNGLGSAWKDVSFIVGWPKPVNPCVLYLDSVSATRIYARWDLPAAVDSIRLLYIRAPDTVQLGEVNTVDLARYTVARLPTGADQTLTLSQLQSATTYQVGLQIMKNLQWSDITAQARKTATTKSPDASKTVDNSIIIDTVWFDGAANLFRIAWHVDLLSGVSLEAGVVCSPDSARAATLTNGNLNGGKVLQVTSPSGQTAIDLGAALLFDTLYHVTMWLRNADDGPWAYPTAASRRTVRTPVAVWQAIQYFVGSDTASVFGGRVAVRKDPNADSPYPDFPTSDTVRIYAPPSVPAGLVQVGSGFTMGKDPLGVVLLGLKFDSIPAGYTSKDLGVYRDSSGTFLAVYGASVDYAARMVWAPVNSFVDNAGAPKPYVVMADLTRPQAAIAVGDTADLAQDGVGLTDTAVIIDNIGNVRWKLVYAKDDEAYSDAATRSAGGYVCGSCPGGATLVLSIPGNVVTREAGVRALLIVSDGPHTDTINISRRARRDASDPVTTIEQSWIPVYATAELENPDIRQALAGLAESGKEWAYDNTLLRVFRCIENGANADGSEKWVEFGAGADSLFRFTPGRVFWVKTRHTMPLNLGPGATLSLKQPYWITAPGMAWTDIAPPFKFPIRVGDILDASQGAIDSVEFYSWSKEDAVAGGKTVSRFVSALKYSTVIPNSGLIDKADTLDSKTLTSYTVLNLSRTPVRLGFPPIPWTMSKYKAGVTKKASASDGWAIKIVSRLDDGMALSPVYCGFRLASSASVRHLPMSPSFAPCGVGVYERETSQLYGHSVVMGTPGRGYTYEIVFSNQDREARTFSFRIEAPPELPEDFAVRAIQPGSVQPVEVKAWQQVTVAANSRESRMIVVGDAAFLDDYISALAGLRFALVSCHPNPFSSRLRISFELPGLVHIGAVRFCMYNMQGRIAWSAEARGRLAPGANWVTFTNLPPAGAYILTMTAIDENGRVAGRQKMRVLSVR